MILHLITRFWISKWFAMDFRLDFSRWWFHVLKLFLLKILHFSFTFSNWHVAVLNVYEIYTSLCKMDMMWSEIKFKLPIYRMFMKGRRFWACNIRKRSFRPSGLKGWFHTFNKYTRNVTFSVFVFLCAVMMTFEVFKS